MDRRVIACTIAILLCASVAWGRGDGVFFGFGASGCDTGDIIHESFDPTGGDNVWTSGYVTAGCAANLDASPPVADGFDGESATISVDGDAYSEAWKYWVDSSYHSTIYIRFYLYIDSEGLDDGEAYRLLAFGDNVTAPTTIRVMIKQSSAQLIIAVIGTDLSEDLYNISTGNSYLVEIFAANNGASDSFEWKVNSVSQGTQSGTKISTDFKRINLGVHPDTATTAAINYSIDKLDISSTHWLGPCN